MFRRSKRVLEHFFTFGPKSRARGRGYITCLIVLPGSAVKIRASSVLLCVAASPLLTARMSMQSYPAAVTITVVVSVVIQVPLSPSLSSLLLPHRHRRRVGCHRHNCRHQRLLLRLVSTSLMTCSQIISVRGFLCRPVVLANSRWSHVTH